MREMHSDGVISVIDGWLSEFKTTGEYNRDNKVAVYNMLTEYQTELSGHSLHTERIDSEFDDVFNQMTDWFFNNYAGKIYAIAKAAADNDSEIKEYLIGISENIDEINTLFFFSDTPTDSDTLTDSDTPPNTPVDRKAKVKLFTDLTKLHKEFSDGENIFNLSEVKNEQNNELDEILELVKNESIIGQEKLDILYGKIDDIKELYSESDKSLEAESKNIQAKFDADFAAQRKWFEGHYAQLVSDITILEIENDTDDKTVKSQINGLKELKQIVVDDGVVLDDFVQSKNEQIEILLQEYEEQLESITELIKEREKAAAAAAAAKKAREEAAAAAAAKKAREAAAAATAAANNRNTTSNNANRNNTSSSSSSSSSSNSSSGSSNTNSSGSSGSSTVTASHNNRYPSISANCKDILARLVRLEAPNESADGKQAVAEVVLNRMVSSRWSHATTVEEVVFDTKWGVQFTVKDLIWTERGTPRAADIAAVDRALAGPNILSKDYMFFAQRAITQNDVIWIGSHAFSK